ncbi:MAG: D-TA family PLP-dependent enzyme [Verrucomicrobiales bacterium]|nr:D-TA family PLP-dependent enzyme [Verrucomicrobiales bacterium]
MTGAPWYSVSNASEVASPALLLYPDRIEENLRHMRTLVGGNAARLRPHVKTHKLAPVIALKRAQGITKFKCSTIAECEMVAGAGGEDVLLAYPLTGPNIRRFLELQRAVPGTRFRAVADDPATVHELSAAATAQHAGIALLIDLNVGMNRTGIPAGDEALALIAEIRRLPGLRWEGLHAYDGHLAIADVTARARQWASALGPVWRLRDRLQDAGHPAPLIVGGGTPTLPFFAGLPEVECGAGTPVLWDFGQPLHNPDLDFLHAAVLLTRVVSRPLPGRLCLDLGHKAVASEMQPPRVRIFGLEDATFVGHSEEHLVIETPRAAEFPVGHIFYALPRHVCPTVALQSEVAVVRDGRVTESWPVTARARRITV